MSGAVRALEESLGVTLFERTTRRVLLSPAGERLAGRARAVLDEMAELVEEAEAARAPFTGVVRLGVIPTCAPYLLPTVLRLFRTEYPALAPRVYEERTGSLLSGLMAGRLDLLLLALPLSVPGVRELPLFDEDFSLVLPRGHELAGRRDLPLAVLRDLDLILLDEGHCMRDQALDICREAGRDPAAALAAGAGGLSTLVQLVAGGLGATLLPCTALRLEMERAEELATGAFRAPAPGRRIGLALRKGTARTAEFEAMADALQRALRPLPVRLCPSAD